MNVGEPVEVTVEFVFDLVLMGVLLIGTESPDAITDGGHDFVVQATASRTR